MQILFIAKSLPGPDLDGYVVRNLGLLRRFSAMGEVDVLSYGAGAMPESLARSVREVITVPDPGRATDPLHKRALEAFSPDAIYHKSSALLEKLSQLAVSRRYDAVWLASWKMLMYLPDARRAFPDAAVIADPADDEVRSLHIERAKARSKRERLALWRKILICEKFERRNLRPADAAIYVSSVDAACTAARHPGLRVEVCQNGVDTDVFAPADEPSTDPVIVFEGTMDFAPNVEGAVHLVREILPELQRRVPDARVLLVGRSPSPEVLALASPSVQVTGTVDDVRAEVLRGAVFACPLLGGTGQKNKIIQAWSMAMPIVATPISVTGLEAVDQQNLLLARGPAAFAEACARLLQDAPLRAQLGASGRRTALETYAVEHRLDVTQSILEKIVLRTPCSHQHAAG